jgi:hypothetical protein
MKRLTLAALLVLALTGSAARADVFAVAPGSVSAPLVLPSAETPNTPGSLLLPTGWTTGTSAPATLDYPALESLWQQAGAAYAIRWQVLAAINKIESNFGRNMGPSSARAVPRGGRRRLRHPAGRLRLQPRRLVRERRAGHR